MQLSRTEPGARQQDRECFDVRGKQRGRGLFSEARRKASAVGALVAR